MYYYPYTYQPYPYAPLYRFQSLPTVRPNQFKNSAQTMKRLLKDAESMTEAIHSSNELASSIMQAAQKSDIVRVRRLLQVYIRNSNFNLHFNPDGLIVTLVDLSKKCCQLQLSFLWGEL
ncbi:hypothetical protein ACU3L3_02035 [Priestia endophytica]|uniref:Uncharacterized protein n=1 Tax=Priestia endophytica DSM 13796 TaxID=1121089 RepID=A0A1I6A3F5_9BACI|nr:hypothetical protein [Priestia endophytica]KYG28327.1 hypothetical protein AZF06_10135 [Priestia endophytica]SFQ63266.1 hypothetical protein SAMN02745910_02489 [Priestia endophytica DSM 13796]